MHLKLAFFVPTLALLAGHAQSQQVQLDGNWTLRFSSPGGAAREGKVSIQGMAGTWQVLASDRGNPCLGREFPTAISDVQPDGFTLFVNGSKVMAGCADNQYKLKRIGDSSFEGQFPDGRKFFIQR